MRGWLFIPLCFLLLLQARTGMAQKRSVLNLPKYDNQWLHFGFSIGINQANFTIHPVKNLAALDTVLAILPESQWGFNLAIISDLRVHEFATLRFLPALSFQDRKLHYTIVDRVKNDTITFAKPVESTILDFPLNLKIRSARLNNFAAYIIGGAKYSVDLASQKDVIISNVPKDAIVKLKKNDFSYEAGFGIDIFFPYFKFSIETKASWGMRDLLVKDKDVFSNSVDKLSSKVFLISFNFEG
ncbi:MAG: outer membrane beta-barrel protein [Bacteroidota bacterium]